jgi:hypothetical protein
VERANQTLQDRLTKELRLQGISSMAKANAYLPKFIKDYNQRFGVTPRCAELAHRPLQRGEDLDRVLTLCERRTLSKNLTLSYHKVIYQIQTKRAAYTMRSAPRLKSERPATEKSPSNIRAGLCSTPFTANRNSTKPR